jgi:hypothetical protein
MTANPSSPDARQELEALLRSRVPLVVIETYDEPRALEMLAALSPRLAAAHTPVFQWTCTDGLRRLDVNLGGSQQHNAEPAAVLKSIRASSVAGIYPARLPSVPRRPGARPAAEGHLPGL